MKLAQLDAFKKELRKFPLEIREDIFVLIDKYLNGETLNVSQFKTFKIDKETKIQEFKVKDHTGNWRAISCIIQKDTLVFVYAFHKKSQALLEKDKDTIRKRIKEDWTMKKEKLEEVSFKELVEGSGVNYEVFKIKQKLVTKIKAHCDKNKISQRALAKLVPGLTQDRISKIFNDHIGGMTIDKLVQILMALNMKVNISVKKAA